MSVADAAAVLGITPGGIRDRIYAGTLPAWLDLYGTWRVDLDAVIDALTDPIRAAHDRGEDVLTPWPMRRIVVARDGAVWLRHGRHHWERAIPDRLTTATLARLHGPIRPYVQPNPPRPTTRQDTAK